MRKGFTLVELLVVVGIVGGLVGLLFPAVQSARESARRVQCSNNLRQLGLASLALESSHGFYPTGGWGWNWVGDGDRGFGRGQPGSWLYCLLPFMEQGSLYSLASDGQPGVLTAGQMVGARVISRTILSFVNCPTRRSGLFPKPSGGLIIAYNSELNTESENQVVRCDYAGSAGVGYFGGEGPSDLSSADSYGWPDTSSYGGVIYLRSEVRSAQIRDGFSNTYLLGEKYLDPRHYLTGVGWADNENAYSGDDNDNLRSCRLDLVPMGDLWGLDELDRFGSAHTDVSYFVFCDGSVRGMGYGMDPVNHYRLGHRRDGGVVVLP